MCVWFFCPLFLLTGILLVAFGRIIAANKGRKKIPIINLVLCVCFSFVRLLSSFSLDRLAFILFTYSIRSAFETKKFRRIRGIIENANLHARNRSAKRASDAFRDGVRAFIIVFFSVLISLVIVRFFGQDV